MLKRNAILIKLLFEILTINLNGQNLFFILKTFSSTIVCFILISFRNCFSLKRIFYSKLFYSIAKILSCHIEHISENVNQQIRVGIYKGFD